MTPPRLRLRLRPGRRPREGDRRRWADRCLSRLVGRRLLHPGAVRTQISRDGDHLDRRSSVRGEDDAFTILLDPSATNRDFEWRTSVPLETGVAKAIEYYRTFGITDTYTHLKLDALRA
jgi:hypothetical protein